MNTQDNADLSYFLYAEQISGDYNEFVKKSVVPFFAKTYQLKIREIRVLNAIASSEDKNPTASQISNVLRQDPATITRSLVILVGKGYILSEQDFMDGRSRILKLTEKGNAAVSHFLQIFRQLIEKASELSDIHRIEYDNSVLTGSLQTVANRAKFLLQSRAT